MSYRDVFILIPCHSLEDFPSEQGDSSAAGLLNAMTAVSYTHLTLPTICSV